jgi:hypothetical protein
MYAENELAIGYLLTVVGVLLLLGPALNCMLDRYAPYTSVKTGTQLAQQPIDVHSPGRLPFGSKSVFAQKATSCLTVTLGVLVGLVALSVSGQRYIPDCASDPYWYKSCIQTAGICLLGMTFIAGSLLGIRNRWRGGMVFLVCTPVVAFCVGYPDAAILPGTNMAMASSIRHFSGSHLVWRFSFLFLLSCRYSLSETRNADCISS